MIAPLQLRAILTRFDIPFIIIIIISAEIKQRYTDRTTQMCSIYDLKIDYFRYL